MTRPSSIPAPNPSAQELSGVEYLPPSEAARRLGVSAKALRLYETHGLLKPARSAAGWRAYGPAQMERAGGIVALRRLGFSLARIGRALTGDSTGLDAVIAGHQASMEAKLGEMGGVVMRIRTLRERLARGDAPDLATLVQALTPQAAPGGLRPAVSIALPWPWGGERFDLPALRALTYIVGPLGSGKTRLAMRLAEALPGSVFLGLQRASESGSIRAGLDADAGWRERVDATLAWLCEDGATMSDDLLTLVAALEARTPDAGSAGALVVDMIEHGLDETTQMALMAHLRSRGAGARPVIVLTRSNAILDLAEARDDETIIFCPANHSPPKLVAPWPGAPGREALASCLGAPDVRARTHGMMAVMPQASPETA